jgi:hypothetical protein
MKVLNLFGKVKPHVLEKVKYAELKAQDIEVRMVARRVEQDRINWREQELEREEGFEELLGQQIDELFGQATEADNSDEYEKPHCITAALSDNFIQLAVDIVTQAIDADNSHEYEKAYSLYKKSLDHFMLAAKYELNESSREMIVARMEGYMERAEQVKDEGQLDLEWWALIPEQLKEIVRGNEEVDLEPCFDPMTGEPLNAAASHLHQVDSSAFI